MGLGGWRFDGGIVMRCGLVLVVALGAGGGSG